MLTTLTQRFSAIFMYECDIENKFGRNSYELTDKNKFEIEIILQSDNIVESDGFTSL